MVCLLKRLLWRWDATTQKQVVDIYETWCEGNSHTVTVFEEELADCTECKRRRAEFFTQYRAARRC